MHFPQILPLQRFLLPLVVAGVLLLIPLSLARAAYLTAGATGALDLHPYWYYGHFVRMGINPYAAFAEERLLPRPARYLDGSEVAPEEVAQPYLERIPGHTASTLLLSALLSYIPWQPLKYGWFFFNLILIAALPWLAMRLLPPALQLAAKLNWLAALSFYAMKGPRFALSNGQPSILIFFLMLVTLLLRQTHWIWAGLALGIALGKYSLSLPLAIFLLAERRFRLVALALLVQLVSLAVVAALEGGSLWQTVGQYWAMVEHFSGRVLGVHLGYLLYDYPQLLAVLIGAGTLVTLAIVMRAMRRGLLAADVLPLNSLLTLWTLLAVYHRSYDTILALFFVIVCLSALSTWQLPLRQMQFLGLCWVLALLLMCLPGEILNAFFAEGQADRLIDWIEKTMIVGLAGMWVLNLWLVAKTPRVGSVSKVHEVGY
jgi:hypothetical protein